MAEFDREALVAAANGGQSKSNNNVFWVLVIALPILGLLAGGVFMTMPSKNGSVIIAEDDQPADIQVAEAQAAEPSATPMLDKARAQTKILMANSYSDQIDRYSAVRMAYSECARILPYKTISNAHSNYRQRNEAKFERLQALRAAEWKAGRADRRKQRQKENDKMMFQAMTGQLPGEALKRQAEFTQMMAELERSSSEPYVRTTPPAVLALLGGEPDLKTCSKFNASLQRGTFDLKVEENS
jgi:hypothetical protein